MGCVLLSHDFQAVVLLIILISGLCCMMGIDTPTRFEAPQDSWFVDSARELFCCDTGTFYFRCWWGSNCLLCGLQGAMYNIVIVVLYLEIIIIMSALMIQEFDLILSSASLGYLFGLWLGLSCHYLFPALPVASSSKYI